MNRDECCESRPVGTRLLLYANAFCERLTVNWQSSPDGVGIHPDLIGIQNDNETSHLSAIQS